MKITKVDVFPVKIPFQRPYEIASAVYTHQPLVVLKVHTDENVWGLGEACPAYEFTGETAGTVENILNERLIPVILNQDPFNIEAITADLNSAVVGNASAKAAVDIALHDIVGKATGQPVCNIIGGVTKSRISVTGQIGMASVSESIETCKRKAEEGVSTFKIKVGKHHNDDLLLLKGIREALGPGPRIWIDANQGWKTADRAARVIRKLEKYDIELVEQPIPSWDFKGLSRIRSKVNVPVMLDESVHSPMDAMRAIQEEACDVISIKLMKSGGIHNALKLNGISEAAGIVCHMGTMLESSIGVSANLHVIAALSNIKYWEADIPTTESGLADDTSTGLNITSEQGCCCMTVPQKPGLGVSLREEALRKHRIDWGSWRPAGT
jgi:L-alanine-DL-glutamate epimerase-like enolase superfamily enzyme